MLQTLLHFVLSLRDAVVAFIYVIFAIITSAVFRSFALTIVDGAPSSTSESVREGSILTVHFVSQEPAIF